MKRALLTGVTGQDAWYLSELLIREGYEVHGIIRGQSNPKRHKVYPGVNLIEGDLTDQSSLIDAVNRVRPDEFYNLGAISFVGMSWQQPTLVSEVTGLGALRCLEALRLTGSQARFYQASSSEMFGKVRESPQTEVTPFHPRSPYGTAKAFAHYATVNYRESYGMHASSGILFNHESPRRGSEFVTRKITEGVAGIAAGVQSKITLGNLDAKRDWGFAGDYMRAAWLMLQQDEPSDFVIATGVVHSIRDVLDVAFDTVGISDWRRYVEVDDAFLRPAEVDVLCGDAGRARAVLGWEPEIDFETLIQSMTLHDVSAAKAVM